MGHYPAPAISLTVSAAAIHFKQDSIYQGAYRCHIHPPSHSKESPIPCIPSPSPQLTFVFASHICIFWARLSLRLSRHHFWDSSSGIIVYWCAWEDRECRWVYGSVDIISQVFVQTGLNTACVGNAPAVIFGWSDFSVPFFLQLMKVLYFIFSVFLFWGVVSLKTLKLDSHQLYQAILRNRSWLLCYFNKVCLTPLLIFINEKLWRHSWDYESFSPKCKPNCFL